MKNFYGRKNDLRKMNHFFEAVQNGDSRSVVVSGPAGSGKTALVTRFAVAAESAGALFFYGKANPLNSSAPFSTLTIAMSMLVKKAIAENPRDRDRMKKAIDRTFNLSRYQRIDIAPVLNLVPALSYLFEDLPMSNRLPAIEGEKWANLRMIHLLEAFASLGRPLILFLDDIQWLDEASHGFLRYMVINGLSPGLLLVMAYRSEESETSEPLRQTAAQYQNQETTLNLLLSGLTKRDTRGFLKVRLDTDQDLTPLADICHLKTAGNPFYLIQLLDELLEKDVVHRKNGEWLYEISFITSLGFSKNVIDLIIERIQMLEEECLALLKQAACIQSGISVQLLEATSGYSREKIETLLWKPTQLNLFHQTGDGFRFTHDRISESLEVLLTEEEARKIHRKLAAFFLAEERRAELETNIFTLLFHYGFYAHTIADETAKKEMTQLYFQAGQQALSRSAYALALKYFTQGKDHYPGDIWVDDYELALAFYRQLAECAYLAGDFAAADKIFEETRSRAKSFSDRLDVEMVKIPCYHAQEKEELALEAGLGILRQLGIRTPTIPSSPRILYAILKAWSRFIFSRKERLKYKRMTPGTDAYKAVQCVSALGAALYYISPQKHLPLLTAVSFNLTLKYGNMEETPVTYIVFGMILNEMTGSVKWGRRLGAMARQISSNFSDDRYKTKEMTLHNVFLEHWDKPLTQAILDFEKAEMFCLRQSDHEFFVYNALGRLNCMIISNMPLGLVLQGIDEKKKVFHQINNRFALNTASFMHQAVANLVQGVREPWVLTGIHFDESSLKGLTSGSLTELYIYKFCVAVYCGRLDIADNIRKSLVTCDLMALDAYQYNYYLFLIALVDIGLRADNKTIKGHLKRLKKYANHNEDVYGNKYLLVLGESLRIKGDPGAEVKYQDAAAMAEKHGFRFEQALACEGLGQVAKDKGDDETARKYFNQAIKHCKQWGLKWKQGLFEHEAESGHVAKRIKIGANTSAPNQAVWRSGSDIQTGESAAEEMVDDILRTMKRISGANVIHMAVQEAQKWKSHVYINDNGIHRPVIFVPLPEQMLAFACATGEMIQADANSIEEQFFDTGYFWKHRPSSLMVIPGKERNGIYIENFVNKPDLETLAPLAEQLLAHFRPIQATPYPMSDIDASDNKELKERCRILQAYMIENEAHQNRSLSLADLAKGVSIPQRTITEAINICLGQNFRTFVNSYRIEAVKQDLLDPANNGKTILEIAYAQGFNSKSTFNDVFKESVGTTPSKFRAGMSSK